MCSLSSYELTEKSIQVVVAYLYVKGFIRTRSTGIIVHSRKFFPTVGKLTTMGIPYFARIAGSPMPNDS